MMNTRESKPMLTPKPPRLQNPLQVRGGEALAGAAAQGHRCLAYMISPLHVVQIFGLTFTRLPSSTT